MEYCGTENLRKHAKTRGVLGYKQSEARRIFKMIVDGVRHIHSLGFCHRDLKFSNILINPSNEIKIVDFGFAVDARNSLSMYCGTPCYMAPEIITRGRYYGKNVDVWALGVILYKLLYKDYPFGGRSCLIR